jgi:hypothetical protein
MEKEDGYFKSEDQFRRQWGRFVFLAGPSKDNDPANACDKGTRE